MSEQFEQKKANYQRRIAQGEGWEPIIADLHEDGLTIVDAIKTVKYLFNVDLGEAQQMVHHHPIWVEEARGIIDVSEVLFELFEGSYGAWLSWAFMGASMDHMVPDEHWVQKVKASLQALIDGDEQAQWDWLSEEDLHQHCGEILTVLIAIMAKNESTWFLPTLQLLERIGYPGNERAIPWLLVLATHPQSTAKEEAVEVLKKIEPEGMAPFLLVCFLNEEEKDAGWIENAERIGQLVATWNAWAVTCGPAVSHLLGQISSGTYKVSLYLQLLAGLEAILPACSYAIPSLYAVAVHQASNEAGQKARQMLSLFGDEVLRPYRYHMRYSFE